MTDVHRADFLAGLRVLELGDGVAGAAAASVLWSLGAEVVALIDPASVHRRGRPRVGPNGDGASLLSVVLDRGKRVVAGERGTDLAALVADGLDGAPFDVVIVDRVLGAQARSSRSPTSRRTRRSSRRTTRARG